MKILRLVLIKEIFDLLASGVKEEAYREIKPYWIKRLIRNKGKMSPQKWNELYEVLKNPPNNYDTLEDILKSFNCEFIKYDTIEFVNGYIHQDSKIVKKHLGTEISLGNYLWGAPEGICFILKIGDI